MLKKYMRIQGRETAFLTDYFLHNLLICGKIEVYYRSKPR